MQNAITVQNVTYVYGEGTPFRVVALDNVSLNIEKGKLTGIIGHTGSGKSTLLQMLNGLVKPDIGKIIVGEDDIYSNKKLRREAAFRVGLVFQYPEYQLFEDTVRKDIAFGPKNMGLSDEEIETRVKEAAAFVGLSEEILEKSPFDISGGQKRRVAIAGILAMKPDILVLDEPASGLDPIGRREIFGGLENYRNATGTTMVIVSHSMEDMARYADDLIVFENGKVIMQGTKQEVFAKEKELRAIGLELPQITRLARRLSDMGISVSRDIYTVDEALDALLSAYGGGDK
ncbi:MAG: energy-coupling factor transporter ATPase [Ruminococcaceae bacterium]|nr:energy-coupling factor transporter ATPase [Oscillospiraceae bacterium]